MFDRSLLPPADLELVVMADTHYMLDPAGLPGASASGAAEFASRGRQTARVERVLQLVASLGLPVVHLGDVVQEFPERPGFQQSMEEATAQIARWGLRPYQVAGNHDVGDKPDPTMPTDWVSPASLADYHRRFGRSWYGFDLGLLHGVVVNAQIFNAALPEAEQQRRWLAEELAASQGRRIALFLHIPLFLRDEDEPALGHYDNVDHPDRAWLLDLIRAHDVELVFAGHSHYAFFNRIGRARSYVAASTTFTRPGFGELFSSAPPPDHGRDDTPKLGFYLARVRQDGIRVHFVRTEGEIGTRPDDDRRQRLVTRLPADLPDSPLGLSLRHALTTSLTVPAAWPSVVRQPVRNDYPLLSTLELGARRVLVPATDLDEPLQRERLAVLREEGVETHAWALWHDPPTQAPDPIQAPDPTQAPDAARDGLTPSADALAGHRDRLDGLTVHLLGSPWPTATCLEALARLRERLDCPLTLSTVVARERVPGKQHDRSRHGYRLPELTMLDRHLAEYGQTVVDRVLCRVDPDASPWETLLAVPRRGLKQVGDLDWLVELSTEDDAAHLIRVAEALFAVAARPGSRLVVDPLVDLDRTMDTFHGLLDRRCNPRPPFQAARALTTLLFGEPLAWQATTARLAEAPGWLVRRLTAPGAERWLIVPDDGASAPADQHTVGSLLASGGPVRLLRLRDATVVSLQAGDSLAAHLTADGPLVVVR